MLDLHKLHAFVVVVEEKKYHACSKPIIYSTAAFDAFTQKA